MRCYNGKDEMTKSAMSVECVTLSILGEERQNQADKGSEEMEDGTAFKELLTCSSALQRPSSITRT